MEAVAEYLLMVLALLVRQLSVNANCQLTHFRDLAKSRPRPKSAVPGGAALVREAQCRGAWWGGAVAPWSKH